MADYRFTFMDRHSFEKAQDIQHIDDLIYDVGHSDMVFLVEPINMDLVSELLDIARIKYTLEQRSLGILWN